MTAFLLLAALLLRILVIPRFQYAPGKLQMLLEHVVVHQLRHQQAAEQGAEQAEAHRDGQGELLEGFSHALDPVLRHAAGDDGQIGQRAKGDGGVNIRQGRGQGDRMPQGSSNCRSRPISLRKSGRNNYKNYWRFSVMNKLLKKILVLTGALLLVMALAAPAFAAAPETGESMARFIQCSRICCKSILSGKFVTAATCLTIRR